MRIESGPTTERIVRNLLFFLMIAGFGAAFLNDGYGGYEAKNFEEHLQSLDSSVRESARSSKKYEIVNSQNVDVIEAQLPAVITKLSAAAQRAELEKVFGGPPSFETQDAVYYFGPDYRYKFVVKYGMLRDPVGKTTAHKMTDLRWQRMIGWILSGVACITGVFLIKVIATKCVMDDNGIQYRFKGSMTWDQLKSLDSSRFLKKGWIDLIYEKSAGEERRMRFDEYHLKHFADFIAEICKRKGIDDPVAQEKALKAQKAGASA